MALLGCDINTLTTLPVRKKREDALEFQDFEWALFPIVDPAHDQIAAIRIMAVLEEVAASVLELDAHVLPLRSRLVQCSLPFTVGEVGSDAFDKEAEFTADHAEEVYDPLLVDGSIA